MIDQDVFKDIMAAAPGPTTIVTSTGTDGRHQGLTMTAVCSASLEPPLLLVCLDHGSNTLRAVRESGSFTVNYVARGNEDVAMRFAKKADDKFDGLKVAVAEDGIGGPVLVDTAAAHAMCRVEQLIEAGDHTVVVGAVVDGGASDQTHVLAYARRKFFTHDLIA
ncbi:hypothetical protein nbrc107696_22420 [Gordonia spumicola]|uniref:Flavin reductase like domain-containing protein n=1 Tax=Gordonia spumicola TaxID=589161 RepID=A0A7I9V982_9ACTN|nr:flavin reductase family protein [Gordonia spumicola]GEE01640.1 hypothetical protein nbrc107696_20860 [Gordonia spumicola]GEE01796.1 hypothetical protein nbrc107696_22420 [Gordonia spumicola]